MPLCIRPQGECAGHVCCVHGIIILPPVLSQGSQGLDCALLAPSTSSCKSAWLFINANPVAGALTLEQVREEIKLKLAADERPSKRHKTAWTETSQVPDAVGEQPCVC